VSFSFEYFSLGQAREKYFVARGRIPALKSRRVSDIKKAGRHASDNKNIRGQKDRSYEIPIQIRNNK
jgi:hypothetical protein